MISATLDFYDCDRHYQIDVAAPILHGINWQCI